MSDKYSIKQIEEAFRKAYHCDGEGILSTTIKNKLIAELTRPDPNWIPVINEVVAIRANQGNETEFDRLMYVDRGYCFSEWGGSWKIGGCRPLTPNEVPGWKQDKEALKAAIQYLKQLIEKWESHGHKINGDPLAKIEEMAHG